ncbi:NAD(P)H:quinone oxidoreductase [Cytophagaceae bacterium ABcell3]|nr:NAD(P)H:quinone oxidoreductase [Cytophagaceae bacterium ABcell3]
MATLKLAIIYYSSTGGNYKMAKMAEGAAKEAGAEVKVLKIKEIAPKEAIDKNPAWKKNVEATKDVPEATLEDLEWADSIIFSIPTRYGNMPSQVQSFIDTTGGLWFQGKLANKVVSGMTSAMNPHGGQETTLRSLYKIMSHWGAILVPTGYTDQSIFEAGGNPYGTSATIDSEGKIQNSVEKAIKHQARRTVKIAKWVKAGLAEG